VEGRRIEDLISGVDRAAQANPIGGLDANSLLNGVAQGQGQRASTGDIAANNVGADIANQIAGGSSTSIDDIINGLDKQGQTPPTNRSTSQEQGQTSAENIVQDVGQGQLPQSSPVSAEQSGGNAQTIQVVSTIITEANGQKIATAVIEAAASGEVTTVTPPAASSLPAVTPVPWTLSGAPSSAGNVAGAPAAAAESTSKAVITVTPPGQSSLPAVTPVSWTLSRAGLNATVCTT
jgi:hypothetical protein